MSKRFEGKVCLVTASSTGIGLAISQYFAKEGATVIINSRSQKNVDEAVQEIKILGGKADGIVCHAGKQEDIKKLMDFIDQKYGRLDVLVPNAAVSTHVGMTLDMSVQQLEKMFDVNVKGTFLLLKEAQSLLQKTQNSNIVVISSYAGYELEPGIGFYSVTKTTLIALVKLLSKELMGQNIRINCVAPGLIKTKFSSLLWDGKEDQVASEMKVNRLGEVTDIANVVGFLASEQASYINGETIVVAGKTSARL